MTPVTASKIFMFTFTFFCVLFCFEPPQVKYENEYDVVQWTEASLASVSQFKAKTTIDINETMRPVRRAIRPLEIGRRMSWLRQHVETRLVLLKSYVASKASFNTAGVMETSVLGG